MDLRTITVKYHSSNEADFFESCPSMDIAVAINT